MKLVKTLIVIAAILLVQTMFLSRFRWLQLIDLFLLANVYYALNFNQISCIGFALSSGLVQDAFSADIVGMDAFSKTVVVYLISSLSSRLMIKHPLIIMLLIGVSNCIDYVIIRGLHRLFGLQEPSLSYQILAAGFFLNSGLGLVGFQIADRIRLRKEYA